MSARRNPGLGSGQCSTHRRVLRHLAHLQQDTVSTPPASGDPAPACATNAGAKALSRKSASAPRLLDAMANEEKAKNIGDEVRKPRLRRCRTPDQQTQRKKLQAAALRNSTPTPPEGRHAVVARAGTPDACPASPQSPQQLERKVPPSLVPRAEKRRSLER